MRLPIERLVVKRFVVDATAAKRFVVVALVVVVFAKMLFPVHVLFA